jgi:hypothetical protein
LISKEATLPLENTGVSISVYRQKRIDRIGVDEGIDLPRFSHPCRSEDRRSTIPIFATGKGAHDPNVPHWKVD